LNPEFSHALGRKPCGNRNRFFWHSEYVPQNKNRPLLARQIKKRFSIGLLQATGRTLVFG